MIKVLYGENSFELERTLEQALAQSGAEIEKLSSDRLTKNDLSNILQGTTLFSGRRLVVIRYLSDNTEVWELLANIDGAANDIILVESKIDKRSKVYKNLQKVAEMREFVEFDTRDFYKIQRWLEDEVSTRDLELNKKVMQYLTEVIGQNQWQLAQALDKISLLEEPPTLDRIAEIIEPSIEQNVFVVFEDAVRGKTKAATNALANIEQTEDVYRLFGLFVSQAINLAALVFSKKTPADVAAELGVSPYALGNLKKFSDSVTKHKMRKMLQLFGQADRDLKTTSLDGWLVVKNLVTQIPKL